MSEHENGALTSRNKEDTYMATEIKKELLQEHFRKHDSIILYKSDGTPVTFAKQYTITLCGDGTKIVFKNYDEFIGFYKEKHLSLKPSITIV